MNQRSEEMDISETLLILVTTIRKTIKKKQNIKTITKDSNGFNHYKSHFGDVYLLKQIRKLSCSMSAQLEQNGLDGHIISNVNT